jgi:hypothetical protein
VLARNFVRSFKLLAACRIFVDLIERLRRGARSDRRTERRRQLRPSGKLSGRVDPANQHEHPNDENRCHAPRSRATDNLQRRPKSTAFPRLYLRRKCKSCPVLRRSGQSRGNHGLQSKLQGARGFAWRSRNPIRSASVVAARIGQAAADCIRVGVHREFTSACRNKPSSLPKFDLNSI